MIPSSHSQQDIMTSDACSLQDWLLSHPCYLATGTGNQVYILVLVSLPIACCCLLVGFLPPLFLLLLTLVLLFLLPLSFLLALELLLFLLAGVVVYVAITIFCFCCHHCCCFCCHHCCWHQGAIVDAAIAIVAGAVNH